MEYPDTVCVYPHTYEFTPTRGPHTVGSVTTVGAVTGSQMHIRNISKLDIWLIQRALVTIYEEINVQDSLVKESNNNFKVKKSENILSKQQSHPAARILKKKKRTL